MLFKKEEQDTLETLNGSLVTDTAWGMQEYGVRREYLLLVVAHSNGDQQGDNPFSCSVVDSRRAGGTESLI